MQRNAFACVSNARPFVDLSTAKIISGTNIIIPHKSGTVIRLWFLKTVSIKHGLRTGYKIRTRDKTRTGKYGLSIKYGLGIKRGLQTAYKIEILCGGSLNQEPDKNAIFFTHFRHGLGL